MSATLEPFAAGLTWRDGDVVIRVTALREDILRVQIGTDGNVPEDASWAVLPEARAARAVTRAEPDGISTSAVRVRVDPGTGALTISDTHGRVILADAKERAFEQEGGSFRMTKLLPADTHIFGLGDKAGGLDRRGRSFTLWNTDAYKFQESTDPLYKAIPFFIGFGHGSAYGLFLDNSFRSFFEFGVIHPERLSFGADGGSIDMYVMAGPSPKDVQQGYAWLTGPPSLPPLWSFGYQQSRYSYMSAGEVRAVAASMRGHRIPCDVLWFDIDALDRRRPFTINVEAFPDFSALIDDLGLQGFRSVIITDLHVPCLSGQDYAPYDSGAAGDHFVHAADGAAYVGEVWPGECCFPDFTREATRHWWGTLFRNPIFGQVAGIWNDMNEPSVFKTRSRTMPLDVVHRIEEPGFAERAASHAEIHNVFGMQNARATHDGLLALRPDVRPFVMSRASYAGGHRHSVVWTGDNSATWNHLRMSTSMLLSLGLGGFAFAGCDLGGFAGSPRPELLTRWLQLGMFNPISRNHTDKGTRHQEPWADGEPHLSIRRRAIEERYRLLPYIYTLAEESARIGLPMMRPLFMEFPSATSGNPLDLEADGQFMLGPSMLVAPAPYADTLDAYQVMLPPGDWHDYWSGELLAGLPFAKLAGGSGNDADKDALPHAAETMPRAVMVTPDLERLPVYVRAGSIIPRQPLVQHTGQTPQGALELAIYPGPACAGSIYLDDGVSLPSRAGFLRQSFQGRTMPDGSFELSIGDREGTLPPWWDRLELMLCGATPTRRCSVPDTGMAQVVTIPA